MEKLEGYILHISTVKMAKSNSKTEFFDMNVQTEEKNVRAVCFSPERYRRFNQYKTDGTGCSITNVIRMRETEVKLTNKSTVKEKNLVFTKKQSHHFATLDETINELEPFQFINLTVKVVQSGTLQRANNLNVREFIVTDNGEITDPVTLFEDLVNAVQSGEIYIFVNFQIVTYQNAKRLRVQEYNTAKSRKV